MINVRDLYLDVLLGLGESFERVHSDEEILRGINTVNRYIGLALINLGSDYIKKSLTIANKEAGVSLPSNYAAFVGWDCDTPPDKWKIMGNKIYIEDSHVSSATLIYLYMLPDITDLDDTINLPYLFYQMFVRFIVGLFNGDLAQDTLGQKIIAETETVIQSDVPISRPLQFSF